MTAVGPTPPSNAKRVNADIALHEANENRRPFVCPVSGKLLRPTADGRALRAEGETRTYPILGGIPRFVDSQQYAESFGTEWTTFRRTQLDSANGSHISLERFKVLSPVPPEELKGKTVLEAGCGMGRFLEIVASQGAHAVGIDLSNAVEAAAENLERFDNVAIAQADLFNLPFAPETFDYIYSFGVIHHTPDPARAVRALTRLLKPGGRLTTWVYGRRGPAWIPRPYQVYTKLLSRVPTNSLLKVLDGYARAALPLGRLPGVGSILRQVFPVQDLKTKKPGQDGYQSEQPVLDDAFVHEWAWLNAFDMFTPKFSTQQDFDQVEGWFREAGLTNLQRTDIRVSVTGTRPDVA